MKNIGKPSRWTTLALTSCLLGAGFAASTSASAQTIIQSWATVKPPAPPELKAVQIDPTSTALLILDFNGAQDPAKGPCNRDTRPRCLASIPAVQAMLNAARAKGVFVVYSVTSVGTPADIATALAPKPGDPVVSSGPDKFMGTDLDKILAGRKIKTVIIAGTGSEGAVLVTATGAALRGMNVIVPVDGMSSLELYAEQYVAWHLTHAPGVAPKTTLTTTGMIKF